MNLPDNIDTHCPRCRKKWNEVNASHHDCRRCNVFYRADRWDVDLYWTGADDDCVKWSADSDGEVMHCQIQNRDIELPDDTPFTITEEQLETLIFYS